MADRYQTAADLGEDLELWLTSTATTATVTPQSRRPARPSEARPRDARRSQGPARFRPRRRRLLPLALARPARPRRPARIDPRMEDPHRRRPTPSRSFPVGLLYGPSGCGKSSLVKAGLLPRLAVHVMPVYVEASADGTESRLLAALRRKFPGLPATASLAEAAAALREGTVAIAPKPRC